MLITARPPMMVGGGRDVLVIGHADKSVGCASNPG
jgi:hypothetical protein